MLLTHSCVSNGLFWLRRATPGHRPLPMLLPAGVSIAVKKALGAAGCSCLIPRGVSLERGGVLAAGCWYITGVRMTLVLQHSA